jgi:hypothetical protein
MFSCPIAETVGTVAIVVSWGNTIEKAFSSARL